MSTRIIVMIQKRVTTWGLLPALELEVMMDGSHQEDALAVGEAEVDRLNHDGERLHDEDAAHDGEHEFLTGDDGHGAEAAAEPQPRPRRP